MEEISKLCGEKKSKEKDKTASTPLITVSDLQRLKQGETIILRTRQWPFKTKLVMNWKIDWGKKYDKAGYPTREKLSIPMFDVKEFVDKVKADKFQSMVGNMNENTPFPFGNPSSNPFGGNPFMNNQDNGINLDDVVKRIDAKIAELEAEEAASKESEDWSFDEQKDIPKVIDETKDNNEVNDVEVLEDNSAKANIEKSEVDNSKAEASKTKDEVTDDEFFDDFWSDGE